ncbi:MAG: hypothetical protein QOG79_6835 [Mycobacterium sp.]|nr:hypothetical protein [Mycobacterium sp.]
MLIAVPLPRIPLAVSARIPAAVETVTRQPKPVPCQQMTGSSTMRPHAGVSGGCDADHRKRLVVSSSRHQSRNQITSGKPLTRERIQSQTGCARASPTIPLRRCPNAGCRRWHPLRLALVAREHNEHNVDSASPVPEHFSNEPFFDSRDEAAAERPRHPQRKFNCTESCPRASRSPRPSKSQTR